LPPNLMATDTSMVSATCDIGGGNCTSMGPQIVCPSGLDTEDTPNSDPSADDPPSGAPAQLPAVPASVPTGSGGVPHLSGYEMTPVHAWERTARRATAWKESRSMRDRARFAVLAWFLAVVPAGVSTMLPGACASSSSFEQAWAAPSATHHTLRRVLTLYV